MSEIFNRDQNGSSIVDGVLSLPETGSLNINAEQIEWQASGVEGFWIKPLFEDPAQKLKTWLMKVDAKAYAEPHAHQEIEQIYILDGSFYDQDKTYHAGDLVVRAPSTMHTSGSENGATVLLIYTAKR